jgi:hypothetical protein
VLVLAVAVVAYLPACTERQPSAPTPPQGSSQITLEPGEYVFVANGIRDQPVPGPPVPGECIGVSIMSFITLSRAGNVWLVRSTGPDDGDLEIRFEEAGTMLGQPGLAGAAQGTVIDRRSAQTLGLASMRLAGAAEATATLSGGFSNWPAPQLAGGATGVITVTSPVGSGTCPRAIWSIRKPSACEATLSCS